MPRDFTPRVLPTTPIRALADAEHFGAALRTARATEPDVLIQLVDSAGLRGRGGAGFPVARKWRTVVANRTSALPSTVVVNAAEGEPGSYKDRAIMRADPFSPLEGALIAAHAVGADSVIVATKASFTVEVERLRSAIAELDAAGWTEPVPIMLVTGPEEYLFGEETALLEVIDGRPPFPRIAPPYREGVDEMFEHTYDTTSGSSSSAHVEMAGPTGESVAPPTLAGNLETFANVPGIVRNGADWFRSLGTDESPGTIVCTVTGDTARSGVGEFALGTPLREVITELGGGARSGHELVAVLSGVANPVLPASAFDTPLTYEAMRAAGSGLGAAGFIVFDDTADLVAVAAGVSRFLAVESCGQCRHCKQDGLALAGLLARLAQSESHADDAAELAKRLDLVAEGARCNLATQQQIVVSSIVDGYRDLVAAHAAGDAPGVAPTPIAELHEVGDGRSALNDRQLSKQPDWTYEPVDSGQWPADRLDDHRAVGAE